jgi:hypothetical protein
MLRASHGRIVSRLQPCRLVGGLEFRGCCCQSSEGRGFLGLVYTCTCAVICVMSSSAAGKRRPSPVSGGGVTAGVGRWGKEAQIEGEAGAKGEGNV